MQQDNLVQEEYVLLDEPLRNLERLRKNDRMLYQPFSALPLEESFL